MTPHDWKNGFILRAKASAYLRSRSVILKCPYEYEFERLSCQTKWAPPSKAAHNFFYFLAKIGPILNAWIISLLKYIPKFSNQRNSWTLFEFFLLVMNFHKNFLDFRGLETLPNPLNQFSFLLGICKRFYELTHWFNFLALDY